MKTVVLGDPPLVLTSLIADRKRLGLDSHDEVWNGEYHMAPAPSFQHGRIAAAFVLLLHEPATSKGFQVGLEFNLGEPHNYRIPDLGVHRGSPHGVWFSTAAMVIEVRSPHDESFEKFDFYFDHGVEEVIIADLESLEVTLYCRGEGSFEATDRSKLLDLTLHDIRLGLHW
jgi:Uma2 family endonuclease